MSVSHHRRGCPSLADPELTCPCLRRLIPDLPSVNLVELKRELGGAKVRGLLRAGKLRRHPRFGYVLAAESL